MTGLTSFPEVVGYCQLEGVVAVGVLEESAALDAIYVGSSVEVVTGCKAYRPFYCDIQALGGFPFHTGSYWQVHGDTTVRSAVVGHTQSDGDKRGHWARTSVFSACAVRPEVILKPKVSLGELMAESVWLYRIPSVHILSRAFDRPVPSGG